MAEFTEEMCALMKEWGWQFFGLGFGNGPRWAKYDGDQAIAQFDDVEWQRDFLAARAVTRNEILEGGIPLGAFPPAVSDALMALGWRWALANVVKGEWFKFKANGMCEARQGDWVWSQDLCEAKREARGCPPAEAWEATPELRWRGPYGGGRYLQQQWRLPSSGHMEWRDVKTVDKAGDPII